MSRLNGKVAVVTGAAQGIGATYALALAAEGAAVMVSDVLDGAAVVDQIRHAGGKAEFFSCDVTDQQGVETLMSATVTTFGRLDILVNNAAIFGALEMKDFVSIGVEEWRKVIDTNVTGSFLCAQAAVPEMKKNGCGRIINISSGTALKGTPHFLHYVSSKGAILAMTKAMATELGQFNITVNALVPGFVLSDTVLENLTMQDHLREKVRAGRAIPRDQTPEDMIGSLLFLASEDSSFMTGQTVIVDGGSVMH